MSNSTTGCWTRCFWCITSCGGKRVPRVSPSDPIPVVSVADAKKDHAAQESIRTIQSQFSSSVSIPEGGIGNGNVNHFYVSDDDDDGGDDNLTRSYTNGVVTETNNRIISAETTDLHLQNSVFIEVGRDRRLRVVHLESTTTNLNPQNSCSLEGTESVDDVTDSVINEPSTIQQAKKSTEDEEDEYWFTKWTRKPRFRSIFEKNTIHCGAEEETSENNNTSVNNATGELSKEFELARAAAAAKRRAWAYNNNATCDPMVEHAVQDNSEEEFNSIDICDSMVQKWSKNSKNESPSGMGTEDPISSSPCSIGKDTTVHIKNNPLKINDQQTGGFTNLGFEEEDAAAQEVTQAPKASHSQLDNTDVSSITNSPNHPLVDCETTNDDSVTVVVSDEALGSERLQNSNTTKQPLLFFIHGISGSSEVWKSQMDFFHTLGFEIVAPDLLGHGYSSTPYNVKYYLFESLAQDLLSVYDCFVEEGRKVVVIGHGYGACLASVITRVRPKSASLLISVAGGGPTPLVSRACCRSSLVPFYCTLFHTNKKKGRFDNPELKHILPPTVHDHLLTGQVWSDGDSAFYRRITVPTLLVYGMKDKVVNLVEQCEMERTIPKSFLEIIDTAGHMVMFDEPVKFNKMLCKFIQSWV